MTTKPHFFIIALTSISLIAAPLHAAESLYLTTDQLDPVAILPPPPTPGSAEEAVDLATTIAVHKAANSDDLAAAKSQGHFDVFAFAPVIGPFFQRDALPATHAFFHRVTKTTDEIQGAAKIAFHRTRPYILDPSLDDGRPENTYSYPSAHSTSGTVDSLILADLFPDKRSDILAFGRNIGWHRVQLGKHFPTDVYAGRVVGLAVYRQLKSSPDFQHDFAAAKAELAAAATAAAPPPSPITRQPSPAAH